MVTRYALAEAFSSRIFTAFYVLCFLPTLVGVFFVYLSHNVSLLEQLGLPTDLMGGLTSQFFKFLFSWQALPAFLVARHRLAEPDRRRPLQQRAARSTSADPSTAADYVLGKMAVLAILLSPITWMMGLSIFVLQAYLEGGRWGFDN